MYVLLVLSLSLLSSTKLDLVVGTSDYNCTSIRNIISMYMNVSGKKVRFERNYPSFYNLYVDIW